MDQQRRFVGREDDLEKFTNFLNDESPNKSQLLLVNGEQGMGKTALLQEMAKRAADQNHYVILNEIYDSNHDFTEKIYEFIAMLRSNKRFELGSGTQWLKLSLNRFGPWQEV
jgi:predicted ATPase